MKTLTTTGSLQAEAATIQIDATVAEAARRMRDLHVQALVVVEQKGGRLKEVGRLRDRDIVEGIVAWGVPLIAHATVGDVLASADTVRVPQRA
jgi:signal-transduction protein with cAMP-binding, CBS, and nucleotidyltransferase domain